MYTLLRYCCRERNKNETKRSLWNPHETMHSELGVGIHNKVSKVGWCVSYLIQY